MAICTTYVLPRDETFFKQLQEATQVDRFANEIITILSDLAQQSNREDLDIL